MAIQSVPAPVLDSRNGDLLAAQAIASLPPELSDRSNSNPIVVLIEAVFARVDALLFQLGQWPQAVIQKCLSLVGVTLNAAAPSTALQTFTLSQPQAQDSTVPAGTLVATVDGSVIFATLADLVIRAYSQPTGTVTFTAGSQTVTGSGTTFTSSTQVGWAISPDGTHWYTVLAIASDTSLTLSASSASSVAGTSWYAGAISGTTTVQSTATGAATAVAAGTLTSLQTQPAGVASTTNAAAATGGADQETIAQAIARAAQAFAARDVACSASDYAYFATQILGQNGRAAAQANTNNLVAQTGYMTTAMLSPAWTTSTAVTAQEGANVARDLAPRTFTGATNIFIPANIQQFVTSPTLPAALVYRQSSTDEATARVNIAKGINSYLNPSTYLWGRTIYVDDLNNVARGAFGIDRVLTILGTRAVGMSWQAAQFSMTFTVSSASVTANAADVANMKPYQTFLVDFANRAGYLVIAASGTTITIDRVYGAATSAFTPSFFHAADTALANWYTLPYANLSVDATAPPASIVVVGSV